MTKEQAQVFQEISKLPPQLFDEFCQKIKPALTDEEFTAFCICTCYNRQAYFPEIWNAIKQALARDMYERFNTAK